MTKDEAINIAKSVYTLNGGSSAPIEASIAVYEALGFIKFDPPTDPFKARIKRALYGHADVDWLIGRLMAEGLQITERGEKQ